MSTTYRSIEMIGAPGESVEAKPSGSEAKMGREVEQESESLPLFVYGTLVFAEVVERLLGRLPEVSRAAAPSWSTRILPGRTYPGLVPDAMSASGGLLLLDLTIVERQLLDDYEGDEYQRVDFRVVDEAGRIIEAETYLIDPNEASEERWTTQWFADLHLADYLAAIDRGESV
jgi:hypothetical protein